MIEIFKDVKGYEGLYQVSNLGRVKSLARYRSPKENILTNSIHKRGYIVVGLSVNGKMIKRTVHQLMAESFLNHTPCKFKLVVDHVNNDKLDNRLENLQLITNRKNTSKDKKGTSKYTGVCWDKKLKKWISAIRINGCSTYLGVYKTEIEASNAYQNKLKTL